MFWAVGAFAAWVLLCNLLLFFSSRRPPAKNFSRFCPPSATQVSCGDDAEAGYRDCETTDVDANLHARDKVADGGNGRQGPADGGGEVDDSVFQATFFRKYEFSAGKGISGYVEEPKAMSLVVQEMFVDSDETSPRKGKESLIHDQLRYSARGEEEEDEDEDEDGPDQYFDVETFMEMKLIGERDNEFEFVDEEEEEGIEVPREHLSSHGDDGNSLEGSGIESPEESSRAGLESEVFGAEDCLLDESKISTDCNEGVEALTLKNSATVTDQHNLSDDDEFIELKLQERRNLLPENIFKEEEEEQGMLGLGGSSADFSVQKEPDGSTLESESESDSESNTDSLWEHYNIVEQLKMELKNARTGGLPTILEESESEYESPNTGHSDLKAMKIDGKKIENKDRLEEIQKVYKSYAERMKKLDVLNSQTLHAIGLVQLKYPLKSNGADGRCSVSKVTQNSWKSRWRRRQVDPVMESVGTYYKELEMVYIGHVCLSWEILQWEYGKVQELIESSCSRSAEQYNQVAGELLLEQYNQVAGELQLFQVLLQRFLEDEPFRGSRIENYARTRCVLRRLLQVPAIKDDCFKNTKARVRDEDAVSGSGLITLIEESMRVFWEFILSDKHDVYAFGVTGQQSAESDLVMYLRTQVQKKERRLKEISRCEGCIVKKLQKKDNGGLHHTMLLAQIELRLISRVLKVGRLTRDQVAWCGEKLERINLEGRTIRVEKEPSFLVFPC